MAGTPLPSDFMVKLTPRAAENRIEGWENRVLRVRVRAAPVDGKANHALLQILSDYAGLPPSAFRIVRGATSRLKRIRVGS